MFENYYWQVYRSKKDWFVSHRLFRKTKNGHICFGNIEEYLNDGCYINIQLNSDLNWHETEKALDVAKLKAITKAEELYKKLIKK